MGVSNSRQPDGRSRFTLMLRPVLLVCLLCFFISILLLTIPVNAGEIGVIERTSDELPPSVINLNMQDAMRTLRRMKRQAKHPRRRNDGGSVGHNETGKCVISADQAVHYCGFTEEVTAPIIPPPQQGQCYTSPKSGREICYPTYEELDTTCTDSSHNDKDTPGPVPPPAVPHATVRAMAFVAPDDLQRLIKQYYRQNHQPIPKDINYKINAYLFARYRCDYGYEMVDEVDTVFCSNRKWVTVMPECRGKGPCREDNGGCSHSCISPDNVTVECRCPKGMVLDVDEQTCIKPAPKNLCKNLAGCTCESINENQLSCICRPSGEKCLLQKGPPKIYMHPPPPYQVEPGGTLNITCSGVGYPFPQTTWQSNGEVPFEQKADSNAPSNQVLSVNELSKNGVFTCHSFNKHGPSEKTVDIIVAGPGAASLDRVDPGRTNMEVYWHPPEELNQPNRHVMIEDLRPDTQYTIRVRANDNLGPGKLSDAISVKTKEAAKRPVVEIAEGEELRVPPGESFTLNCNITRGDPTPHVVWESKGRKISNPQEGRSITLQHKGLYEETSFLCVAENEAGKTSKRVHVIVTGPIAPEKIRSDVDGDDVSLQWDVPRITNGPMEDYELLYTTDPSLPEDQWERTNSGGKTEITLPDLKEMTEYTVRIRGKNVNGDGLPSRDHTFTTWLKPRPPVVTLRPSDPIVAAPSTQELTVECDATGVPKPKIVWFWQNEAIEDGKDGFRVYDTSAIDVQNLTNSKLIAQSTTRTGVVRCEAVNREGDDRKSVDIKINGPGSPPLKIQPSTVENGFKVDWTEPEIPNGEITNYVIYYTKDPDKPLGEWQTETVPGDKLSELIANKEEDTPYVVRLQAVTDDGPGIISEPYEVTTGQKHIPLTVKLELIDPVLEDGAKEVVVEPAQPIRFRCIAEGRPTPAISYTWLPLNNSESGQEPIHIRASPHDSAEHTYVSEDSQTSTHTQRYLLCQARNPDGTVDDRVTFTVKKPGSPPLNIAPTIDLDNKVTIQWNPPIYPNGDLDHYKVYLSADPSKPLDQWQTFDVHDLDNPKIEFNRGELEPETPYFVQISSINKDGEGVKSEPKTFETVSGAPIDSPADVLAVVEPDNTVNLSWAGPSQPNGPIKSYTVYFTPVDSSIPDENYKQWQKIDVPSDADLGNITLDKDDYKIQPNTPYKVRVTATNDLSEGPASEPITFTTGTGEIPPTIQIEPSNNPASVNPKEDYTVTCAATGIPQPEIYWTVGDQRTDGTVLQLSSLVTDTIATCHAENNAGKAQEVLRIEVKGPGAPPTTVAAEPLPDQELTIEWTPPDITNGQITGYVVQYGEIPDGETTPTDWQTMTVPGAEVTTTLKDLKPKTNYAVKVQAVSDRGPGVISDPTRVRTMPLTPPPPQEAKVDVHDNNTVLLEFDAVPDPEDSSKKIKDYVISYTAVDPLTNETVWNEMSWTHPDDSPTIKIPIDGENFKPNTKYNVKIIPKGEIEGKASDPVLFETGDGIIAPDQPTFNVDAPDNLIRVPAGTDYSVTCSSEGHPSPKIHWINEQGETVSEGPVLRMDDVKTTQKLKCIAENVGGTAEEDFTIYVAGPGNAPEITQLHAHKPRTIEAKWDPPTIPNGEITRYIIYYTPLDDQDPSKQVGQVPSKPIVEWLTYHQTGENLNEGQKSATIKDFLEPDTAYAVVIQAVNDDGPGPYSIQHTIRTMSKAQEDPPSDLRVEPIDQRSVEVDWKPPENVEEQPIGYELYYVPANKEIEVDEFDSLPKWVKIPIDSGDATSHVLRNELEPNTEYVFKIRAIYPNGPGVFSEPCITRTLPEGHAPVISVSSGGEGTDGSTKIDLLPGSSLLVFCNATGSPQPSVNWIRQGSIAIDPSTVKAEETATRWSLNVANITEDTTFICVAQNPLGIANWSIALNVIDDLPLDWRRDMIKAKIEDDNVLLSFDDKIPEHLKEQNNWKLRYTDDPNKPKNEWDEIDSDGNSLSNVKLPDAKLGKVHYITVTDPNTGIESSAFTVITPNPARITNLGANINDEVIVDFNSAVGSSDVKNYEIRFWPVNEPDNVRSQTVGPDSLSGNVISDLSADTDYDVQVVTTFSDGDVLPGAVVPVRTPPEDLHCDCSHACRLDKDNDGKTRIVCYCPTGYELMNDGKTCTRTADTDGQPIVVEVTPSYNLADQTEDSESTSETGIMPTNELGQTISVEDDELTTTPYPTDSLGRFIKPIVRIDGQRLPVDNDGNTLNPLGQIIERNEEDEPLGPDGQVLQKNEQGEWLYPELDQSGKPLPFDKHGRPVYPILDSNDNLLETNRAGQRIDKSGNPIPTSAYGKPVGPDGSPLPFGPDKIYRWHDDVEDITDEPQTTDIYGRIIFPIVNPDGELLQTSSDSGRYVDQNGAEIPLNDAGVPLNPQTNQPLEKNERNQYIFGQRTPVKTEDRISAIGPDAEVQTTERIVPIVNEDGRPLPTNYDGEYLDPDGNTIERDSLGRALDSDKRLLPTDSSNNYVFPDRTPSTTKQPSTTEVLVTSTASQSDQQPTNGDGSAQYEHQPDKPAHPTDTSGRPAIVIGPDGQVLPTDSSGQFLQPDGSPVPTNFNHQHVGLDGSPLPTNSEGNVVLPDEEPEARTLPTDSYGKEIHKVVGPDASVLPTDNSGRYVDENNEQIPVNDFGWPIGPDGQVLPRDSDGNFIYTSPEPKPNELHNLGPDSELGAKELPTDESGKNVYPIVDAEGNLLPVDSTGRHVTKQNEEIVVDEYGRPLSPSGELLPKNEKGEYVFKGEQLLPTHSSGRVITVVNEDGVPLEKNSEGYYVKDDGTVLPTNAANQYVGPDSSPLPIDSDGRVVIYPDSDREQTSVLPTDDVGKQIYPVVDEDGKLLEKDSTGRHVNQKGEPIEIDEVGRPLSSAGKVLPTNNYGQYIHKSDESLTEKPLPTDDTEQKDYRVVGPDHSLLPTDSTGRFLTPSGAQIEVDSEGHPIDAKGQILPVNPAGEYIYIPEDGMKPTNAAGQPVIVIGPDGVLATNSYGNYIDPDGNPLPTNPQHEYVGPDGSPLPRDESGNVLLNVDHGLDNAKTLPTDEIGKEIHPVVDPHGNLLGVDRNGHYVSPNLQPIPTDDYGRPLGPDNSPLPKNQHGQYVYSPVVNPIDQSTRPLGNTQPDGQPQTTEPSFTGRTLPTDEPLPTDSNGRAIYPIVNSNGQLLPTDYTHHYTDDRGDLIPLNDRGEPIGPDNQVLPRNEHGQYIHGVDDNVKQTTPHDDDKGQSSDEHLQTLPTDESGRTIHPIVKPDGSLLERDSSGRHIDEDGKPIQIDDYGRPIDSDGNVLPKNKEGDYIYSSSSDLNPTTVSGEPISPDATLHPQTLPTDSIRKIILPVVDEHGTLRPTQETTGLFLDLNGDPLETDEFGRPYSKGELLPQNEDGNYVYEDRRKKDSKYCYVDGYIELIIVLDTSANVKILDHRLMKETIKSFLKDNFDLRANRVRVGVVKYGSEVEVPIALGDYNTAAELLNRIGDARRLKGAPRLGEALRDTVSEFTISGSPNAPKVVIVIKNGKADDEFGPPAEMLRDQIKAEVFVVTVGEDEDDNSLIVGSGKTDHILHFKNWRDTEPDDLGVLADAICRAVPEERRQASDTIWPTRTTHPTSTSQRDCSTIEYEVDLVVVLDSSKFTDDEFTKTLEGVGTLVDESFDLAPDVVRVGFVVFSDKVSVPVALGHYEDKIELLSKIEDSESMEGTAIAVKGLDAAREQFQLHGRNGVSKVVLLITNGNYRGNAASFAQDLREKHDIQLFVLAINAAATRHSSLARLVGVDYANERLLKIQAIDDIATELNFIRTSLCGRITHNPIRNNDYETTEPHRTSKREVTLVPISFTKGLPPPPSMCNSNRGKMSINIVIDSNGGENVDSTLNDVQQALQTFLKDYYEKIGSDSRPNINLLHINSHDRTVLESVTNVSVGSFNSELSRIMDKAKEENELQQREIAAACEG
ncbi:hypothetical protein M3Y96_00874900 [Aphelenchoides besseyi]|nr:hypothetical protein M3Y96_00874900 [Aphelenchoides besseyi]